MGWVRGNPRALLILFFAFAVFLSGSLSASFDVLARTGGPLSVAALVSQFAALSFVLLILGRILWVTGGYKRAAPPSDDNRGTPP